MKNLVPSALRSRTLPIVGAFLLVAMVAAFLTPQSVGADRCGTEFIYYDWSGNVVGYRAWLPYECNCQFHSWGYTTGNVEIGDSWC